MVIFERQFAICKNLKALIKRYFCLDSFLIELRNWAVLAKDHDVYFYNTMESPICQIVLFHSAIEPLLISLTLVSVDVLLILVKSSKSKKSIVLNRVS